MSYLPEAKTALVEAARRRRQTAPRRSSQPTVAPRLGFPHWRAVLVSLAILLAGAAVALAAAGVFAPGTPVGPIVPPSPRAFEGVAIPGSAKLLPIRTTDPGGGPPWGLRVLQTTRGLTCVQAGRVDFGTVGVLGQDGAFANDGRFHPLSENLLDVPFSCAVTDAHGHGFLNVASYAQPASALMSGGPQVGGCHPPNERYLGPSRVCPARDLRDVYYGLLGPEAISLTYRTPAGTLATTPTTGADGAYLLVLPHTDAPCSLAPHGAPTHGSRAPTGPPCRANYGSTGGPYVPAGAIRAITYRDGHTCQLPVPTSAAERVTPCPVIGFVAPHRRHVTAAQLATPISVRKLAVMHPCVKGDRVKLCAEPPPGYRLLRGGARELLVELSFIARVPVTSSRDYYEIGLIMPRSHGCTTGSLFGPTTADIRAGQRVVYRTFVPYGCPGVAHGTVTYVPTNGPASSMSTPGLPGQTKSITVGRFSFKVP
jgi:hypothetical protein